MTYFQDLPSRFFSRHTTLSIPTCHRRQDGAPYCRADNDSKMTPTPKAEGSNHRWQVGPRRLAQPFYGFLVNGTFPAAPKKGVLRGIERFRPHVQMLYYPFPVHGVDVGSRLCPHASSAIVVRQTMYSQMIRRQIGACDWPQLPWTPWQTKLEAGSKASGIP